MCLVCCRCFIDGSECRYEAILPRRIFQLIGHGNEDVSASSDEADDDLPAHGNKKVCIGARDHDPERQWMRLKWSIHSSSCLYLESFEEYYHMKHSDFEDLFDMMHHRMDPRAGNFFSL